MHVLANTPKRIIYPGLLVALLVSFFGRAYAQSSEASADSHQRREYQAADVKGAAGGFYAQPVQRRSGQQRAILCRRRLEKVSS